MGFHDHDHHDHAAGAANRRRLVIAIVIIASVLVVEVIGAVLSGSLALLADAGHMLSDLIALVIALVATVIAARPPSERRTFGHRRVEVFAAFVNAGLLAAVVISVAVEAVSRLGAPSGQVQALPMLVVAIVGALANVAALLVLRGGAASSINMRAAYLEVLGDLAGSIAVIASSIVILATGFMPADAIASLLIVALILPRVFIILRDVVAVLGQEVPRGTDVTLIREHVLATPGVLDVHDVHVWSVTPGQNVFSAHVVVDDAVLKGGGASALLIRLDACLADHFDVEHSTFQLEPPEHAAQEPLQHP